LSHSKFEERTGAALRKLGIEFTEQPKPALKYQLYRTYTPDFRIGDMFIETKGWLRPEDRTKMKAIKKAHPELDIRFVFQNAKAKLNNKRPKSKTYAQWAEQYGFPWAHGEIPNEWIQEALAEDGS
jgi:hypothetical protein